MTVDPTQSSALNHAEARYRLLFEHAGDAVITMQKGCFIDCNPKALVMFGCERKAFLGKTPMDFSPPVQPGGADSATLVQEKIERLMAGYPQSFEWQFKRPNGTCFEADVHLSAVTLDGVAYLQGHIRDISERKSIERELASYREGLERLVAVRTNELERANREIESFSYSVSHDLRSPLRTISGFSGTLMEVYSGVLDETGMSYLHRIIAATRRMSALIDGLLSLSRLGSNALVKEDVELGTMAEYVVRRLRENDPVREVDVVVQSNLRAFADRHLIENVLENLIGNAWKFTAQVSRACIEVGSVPEGGETVFFVRDNGAGFDMAYSDKLFGVFQRLHGDEHAGTGIGLATVRRIVDRHGGRVWAEGAVDKGACFYFTLGTDE